jgi:hypothetical protein
LEAFDRTAQGLLLATGHVQGRLDDRTIGGLAHERAAHGLLRHPLALQFLDLPGHGGGLEDAASGSRELLQAVLDRLVGEHSLAQFYADGGSVISSLLQHLGQFTGPLSIIHTAGELLHGLLDQPLIGPFQDQLLAQFGYRGLIALAILLSVREKVRQGLIICRKTLLTICTLRRA